MTAIYAFGSAALGTALSGEQAVQVFVSNPAIAKAEAAEAGTTAKVAQTSSPQEAAVTLVQAMYANKSVDGFEMRQRSLKPVYVGTHAVGQGRRHDHPQPAAARPPSDLHRPQGRECPRRGPHLRHKGRCVVSGAMR